MIGAGPELLPPPIWRPVEPPDELVTTMIPLFVIPPLNED